MDPNEPTSPRCRISTIPWSLDPIYTNASDTTIPTDAIARNPTRLRSERAAVSALRGQSALPKGILHAVAARLEHQDTDIRRAAIDTLGGQSALPEEILKVVAAQLRDQDGDIRWAAVYVLGGQSALPEEILQAVAARLQDQDGDVRWAPLDALEGQSALSKDVLSQSVKSLYRIWLERSFGEHLSCYVADEICYIDMPVGLRKVRLEGQQDRFRDAVQETQKALGIPLPDASGVERWIQSRYGSTNESRIPDHGAIQVETPQHSLWLSGTT